METSPFPWITSHLGYLLKLEIVSEESNVSLECQISRFVVARNVGQQDQSVGPFGDGSASVTRPETHFEFIRTISLAIEHCRSARLISLQKCTDSYSGMSRPYVLIQKKTDRTDVPFRCQCVGVFEFDHSLSTLYLYNKGEFLVDHTDFRRIHHRNIHIIDGPSFIWVDNSRNYLGHVCLESETESLAHVVRTDLNDNEDKCLAQSDYYLLGWSTVKNCTCKQILVLGKFFQKVTNKTADESSLTSGISETHFLAIVYEWTGKIYKQYRLRREDVRRIIPHEYSSVVRNIVMDKVEITADKQHGSRGEEVVLNFCRSHIFACTSQKHLLEFVDGHLLRCVDIESGSISRIQVIHSYQLQPHLCLWSSSDRSVMGLRCADLQVEMMKRDVSEVIVDDFLENGTDQLMLLHATSSTWPPSGWSLTDLGPNFVDCVKQCASSSCSNQEDMSSIQAALKALQMRLQSDINRLVELTSESHDRQRLVELGCDVVNRLTLNHDSVIPDQPSLVPLLGHPENFGSSGYMTVSEPPIGGTSLEVKDTWQRLCDGCWVIGVEVCNMSDKELGQLALSACLPSHVGLEKENQLSKSVWPVKTNLYASQSVTLSRDDDWIYQPVAFKFPRLELSEENQDGDKLKPGETTTVLCVLSQPLFGVTVTDHLLLFLTFSCGKLGNQNRGKQTFTVFCGKVEFSKEDLFENRKAIDLRSSSKKRELDVEVYRSRLSLDAVQSGVRLSVMSTPPALTSVATALTRAGLTHQPLYDCYLCPQGLDHLRWVRLQLTTTRQPLLKVMFRNKSQLWSVLHYLYHILPDDVAMIPAAQSEAVSVRSLHRLRQMLRQEAEFSTSKLSELLDNCIRDDDIMEVQSDDIVQGHSTDAVQDIRHGFSCMQKNVQRLRKDDVISQKHFQEFLSDLRKHIQSTDSAVLQLYETMS